LTLTFDARVERVDRITARQGSLRVDFVRSDERAVPARKKAARVRSQRPGG
jgi:hypothetical protein